MLTHGVRVSLLASGSTCRRSRPEPWPRTSTITPTKVLCSGERATMTLVAPADHGLIDLNLIAEQLALGSNHRPAQLLQDQPRRLIARDPELALELHR